MLVVKMDTKKVLLNQKLNLSKASNKYYNYTADTFSKKN